MSQHATLSEARWRGFPLDSQILMMGNEMNRARRGYRLRNTEGLLRCYERLLNLLDLTVRVQTSPTLRRELLRFRDLIAALYVDDQRCLEAHDKAFRVLLLMTAGASKQIKYLLPSDDSQHRTVPLGQEG